jgi:hypothetical protein
LFKDVPQAANSTMPALSAIGKAKRRIAFLRVKVEKGLTMVQALVEFIASFKFLKKLPEQAPGTVKITAQRIGRKG